MADQGFVPRRGREGSRWYNERPSGEEVAAWFRTVKLHDGMEHADFVSGITLIQQAEARQTIVGYRGDGTPESVPVEEIVFTPYPRVETRVSYFWSLCELRGWTGRIEPVDIDSIDRGLPPGYFRLSLPSANGKDVPLVGRAVIVSINDARGFSIGTYPSETKLVPLLRNGLVDADAFAKASTGAIGRALGAAGMLVIPGSGVATADDMRELPDVRTDEPLAAVLESAKLSPDQLREQLRKLVNTVGNSDKREEMNDWWTQRHFPPVSELLAKDVPVAFKKLQKLDEDSRPTEQTLEVKRES